MRDAGPLSEPDASWPSDAPRFTSVSVGTWHGCGLTEAGTVWCWGSDAVGQLGQGLVHRHECGESVLTRPCRPWAEPIPLLDEVVQIETHESQTCARDREGAVWCYGTAPFPLPLPPLTHIALAGNDVVYGVAIEGSAWRWSRHEGAEPLMLGAVAQVAAGREHACVLSTEGEVICWGSNREGQLARPMDGPEGCRVDCDEPLAVTLPAPATELALSGSTTCAVLADGAPWCWGRVGAGSSAAPRALPELTGVTNLQVSGLVLCGLLADGSVACLDADRPSYDYEALGPARDLALHGAWGCAVRDDGAVLCAGTNQQGQLGRSPVTSLRGAPLPIALSAPAVGGEPPPPPSTGDPDWIRLRALPARCAIDRAVDPGTTLPLLQAPCENEPPSCRTLQAEDGSSSILPIQGYHDGTRGYVAAVSFVDGRRAMAIITSDGAVLGLWAGPLRHVESDGDLILGCGALEAAVGDGFAAVWLETDPWPSRILHAPLDRIGELDTPTWLFPAFAPRLTMAVSSSTVAFGGTLTEAGRIVQRGSVRLRGDVALVGGTVAFQAYDPLRIQVARFDAGPTDLIAPVGEDVLRYATDGQDLAWVQASPAGSAGDYTSFQLWTSPFAERAEELDPRSVGEASYLVDPMVVGDGWVAWSTGWEIVMRRLTDGAERRFAPADGGRIGPPLYVREDTLALSLRRSPGGTRIVTIDPRELPLSP